MIKNVIFDIGMVLVDFRWKELFCEVGCDDGEIAALDNLFFGECLWDELDLGIFDEEEVIAKACDTLPHLEGKITEFWERRVETIDPYDYALPMIKELKERGLNVYLLTNYPRSLYAECKDKGRFPFYDLIDGEVVSSHVKIRKPDREIYEALLNKYSLKADECIFTDDRPINIEGAAKLGINAFVFEGYKEAMAKISEIEKRHC